jgi:hypothetical protein
MAGEVEGTHMTRMGRRKAPMDLAVFVVQLSKFGCSNVEVLCGHGCPRAPTFCLVPLFFASPPDTASWRCFCCEKYNISLCIFRFFSASAVSFSSDCTIQSGSVAPTWFSKRESGICSFSRPLTELSTPASYSSLRFCWKNTIN